MWWQHIGWWLTFKSFRFVHAIVCLFNVDYVVKMSQISQISQISISDQNEDVIFSDNEHDEATYRSQTQEIQRILSNVISQLDKDDINEIEMEKQQNQIEDKHGNEKLEKDKENDLSDDEKDRQEAHQVKIQRENNKIDYLVLDDIESQGNKSIDELSECSSVASYRSFRKFKFDLRIFGEVIKDENGNLSAFDQIYLEQCQVWFKRETRKRKGKVNCIFSQIIKNKIVKS